MYLVLVDAMDQSNVIFLDENHFPKDSDDSWGLDNFSWKWILVDTFFKKNKSFLQGDF